MRLVDRVYINFSRIIPVKPKKNFQDMMIYAGMSGSAEGWLGNTLLFGLLISLIVLFIPLGLYGEFRTKFIVAAIGAFIFVFVLSYLKVYFKMEERTRKVEDSLSDVFQIIAANLRSGMTPYKALKLTAKKEFGPLQEEIKYATSRALGTESFSDTLLRMSERIKSDMLDRSLKLFTTAMRSGGHLASLLEDLANDISETRALKNEMITNTKTYTAFIMFTIIIGTPLLLAISINFVEMITSMQEKTSSSIAGFGMGFLAGEVTITADFLTSLSLVMLFMTAVLASMLIGVINEGKAKYGLKYAPTVVGGCYLVFFVSVRVVGKYIVGLS